MLEIVVPFVLDCKQLLNHQGWVLHEEDTK